MELYSSSRAQYLLKLFGILLHGSFFSFFSFISLFSYLFMLWTFTLYFELQCNFVLKLCYSGCFGFGPSELFQWLPYSFDISPSLSVFCFRGVFKFFFLFWSTSEVMSSPATWFWFLIPLFNKRNHGSPGKWLIPGLG